MLKKEEIDLIVIETLKNSAINIFNNTNKQIYLDNCTMIDKLDLTTQEKEEMKNTHLVLFLIKSEMLKNPEHNCCLTISKNEIILGETKIDIIPNFTLLKQLCEENGINAYEEQNNISLKINFDLNPELLNRKTK